MRGWCLLAGLLLGAVPARAVPCEGPPATNEELRRLVTRQEDQLFEDDVQAVLREKEAVEGRLACLVEVVEPDVDGRFLLHVAAAEYVNDGTRGRYWVRARFGSSERTGHCDMSCASRGDDTA